MKEYRLTLLFGVAALVVMAIGAIVMARVIGNTAQSNLIRIAQKNASNDGLHVLSMMRTWHLHQAPPSAGTSASSQTMEETQQPVPLTLESLAGPEGLPSTFPTLVEGFNIAKFNLFDPNGRAIWSTDPSTIDTVDYNSLLIERALAGGVASEFARDKELVDVNGVHRRMDVVETYLPVRETPSGPIIGVMEIYRDVTEDVSFLIDATSSSVLRVTGETMGGLFIVLLAFVVAADVTMNRSKRRERSALESRMAERKRAEEELRESNLRLEEAFTQLQQARHHITQQERLRALGQMASGIAHDFNNALTPILGFSDLLVNQPSTLDDKETVHRYAQMINIAAQDASAVVSRMREFYRNRDQGEAFTSVNLHDLVGHVISLTQAKWKDEAQAKGITIAIRTELEKVPPIAGNEADLREALANLILNAVDAMPNGGTIAIATRPNGKYVTLEVSDTGIGMTEEVRQRCLDPFFTTKGTRGTGMGLAIVYGIVQRHEGTIDIRSKQGKGTTFIIRLPIYSGPKAKGRREKAATQSRALHILVVDDESPVRQLLTEYLLADGHTVEAATNGEEALEKFTAGRGRCDLVITDRAMPGMSGDQLAAAIKTIAPRPVILLTGFGGIIHATGEKPVDVDLVVSKPVSLHELREAVAKATAGQVPPSRPPKPTK